MKRLEARRDDSASLQRPVNMSKSVLMSYQQRNKIVKIPEGVPNVDYLQEQFMEHFSIDIPVGSSLSFQRFDREWEEYVELDTEAVLGEKERLRVIIIQRDTSLSVTKENDEVCV